MVVTQTFSWLNTEWPPLLTLLIASAILVFVGYINWHPGTKANSVRWVAQHIYRKTFRSELLADNMFMTATAYLLSIGGIIFLVSLWFLTGGNW